MDEQIIECSVTEVVQRAETVKPADTSMHITEDTRKPVSTSMQIPEDKLTVHPHSLPGCKETFPEVYQKKEEDHSR